MNIKKYINTNENTRRDGKLIIALGRAMTASHKESEVLFRQAGLTMAQFAVLEALHHKGDLTVGQLIDAVLSTSGNMTVVIRNLEKLGYVCRKPNPTDKRSFIIHLTDSGNALIDSLYHQHMALVEKSLSVISAEEKETVIKILKKLR